MTEKEKDIVLMLYTLQGGVLINSKEEKRYVYVIKETDIKQEKEATFSSPFSSSIEDDQPRNKLELSLQFYDQFLIDLDKLEFVTLTLGPKNSIMPLLKEKVNAN